MRSRVDLERSEISRVARYANRVRDDNYLNHQALAFAGSSRDFLASRRFG